MCSGALLCDDFEASTAGAEPGAPWSVSGSVEVTNEEAYSGENAIKVTGAGGGYNRNFMSLDLTDYGDASNQLYGRMMVRLSEQGANGGDFTFVQAEGTPAADSAAPADTTVMYRARIDGSDDHIMANYDTWVDADGDGATDWLTDCWKHPGAGSSGYSLPKNEWACVEWHFDAETDQLMYYLNGEELTEIGVNGMGDGCISDVQDNVWEAPEFFSKLHLGVEQYHPTAQERVLYIDDVQVDSRYVGCPDMTDMGGASSSSAESSSSSSAASSDASSSETTNSTSSSSSTASSDANSSSSSEATNSTSSSAESSSSSASSSPMVGGTGDVLFSEDFESGASGSAPEGWNYFVGYQSVAEVGDSYVRVDSERAYSGNNSFRSEAQSNSGSAQISMALPDGLNKVYMRAYIYSTREIGGRGPNDSNHETIIALRGDGGNDEELRFGEAKGTVGTNRMPGDPIAPNVYGPDYDASSQPVISANEWNCVEVAVLADTPEHQLIAWVNGTEVHRIEGSSDWHSSTPANWADGMFKEAVFGYQSWSSIAAPDLWYDDIVVSTERVGCN